MDALTSANPKLSRNGNRFSAQGFFVDLAGGQKQSRNGFGDACVAEVLVPGGGVEPPRY
jgi:hypothetical protein